MGYYSDDGEALDVLIERFTIRFGVIFPRWTGMDLTEDEISAIDWLVANRNYAYSGQIDNPQIDSEPPFASLAMIAFVAFVFCYLFSWR